MFLCIENDKIISILDYEPELPPSVRVVEISKEDHEKIIAKTHLFNVLTNSVEPQALEVLDNIHQEKINSENKSFLDSTDWKVLRHIREKALGIQTSVSEEEYLKLETERQSAADSIK